MTNVIYDRYKQNFRIKLISYPTYLDSTWNGAPMNTVMTKATKWAFELLSTNATQHLFKCQFLHRFRHLDKLNKRECVSSQAKIALGILTSLEKYRRNPRTRKQALDVSSVQYPSHL